MTRDQQMLAIWCGGAAALLITSAVIFSARSSGLEETTSKADSLYADYRKLYPDQGTPAEEALKEVQLLRDHQKKERQDAESGLVAILPAEYQRGNVTDAGAKLNSDVIALKQRAERQKIGLPATLPYEGGVDQDPAKSSLQLANLFLYKQVLDLCLDAGVTKVVTVREGRGHRDASGLYAVVTCEISVEGNYESLTALLDGLRTKHDAGIGIRGLQLSQGQQTMTASLVTSLITIYNPAWQLPPEAVLDRRGLPGGAVPPANLPPKRTRLGG